MILPAKTLWRQVGCCGMIAFLGIVIYGNHLQNAFQFDSVAYVVNSPKLQAPDEMLTFEFLKKDYFARSLLQISLAVNAKLGGFQPFGYHLFNLTFHIFNALLVFFITGKLCRFFSLHRTGWNQKSINLASLLTALLFLCHPIQTESVVYIMSRSEVLAGTFYLTGFFIFQSCLDKEFPPSGLFKYVFGPAGIILAFIFGFSVKQTLITLPAVLLLYLFCQLGPESRFVRFFKRWKWVLGGIACVVLALLLRKLLIDETFLIGPSNPEEMVGRKKYMLSQPSVIVFFYLRLLLFPINLNIDPDIPVVTSLFSLRFLLPAGLMIGLVYATVKTSAPRIAFFCILWFLIILSPSSSIVTLHDLAAEHRIYLAAYGFCLISSVSMVRLMNRLETTAFLKPTSAALLLILFVAFLAATTGKRNLAWRSELSLWEDARKKSPHLVRPLINLGRAYSLTGQTDRAIYFYEMSLKKAPGVFVTYYNLGELYLEQGRIEAALKLLHHAEKLDSSIPEVHASLGEIYLNTKQYELAEHYFRRAVELNPKYAVALRNLGILNYFHLDQPQQGIVYFSRSLTLDPNQPEAEDIRKLVAQKFN